MRKQIRRLQARRNEFDRTEKRISSGNFKPNATGPKHKQHRPGSMNAHKSLSTKRER